MADLITNNGLDLIEEGLVNGLGGNTLDTVAVGSGTSSPSRSDTSLKNNLFEADISTSSVTRSTTAVDGEIRYTLSVTGGTEVPAPKDLSEFAIKSSTGTLFYYEVKSVPISIQSGETKTIEIRIQLDDPDTEDNTALTNDGLNFVRDILTGNTTDLMDTIAVGGSTQNVSQSDSSMYNELYRNDSSGSDVSIETETTIGQPSAIITVSAGSDVSDQLAADTDVSEFGLISSTQDVLILHETRDNPVTLQAGDEKSFSIPLLITQ